MIEKYDPFLAEKLRTERIEESRVNAQHFFEDLKGGVYDVRNLFKKRHSKTVIYTRN